MSSPGTSSSPNHPVIIIGSGLAGYNVAREFRKINTTTDLVLIADDGAEFYSKPMLSNALAKNKTAQELAMADAAKMANDINATILKHTRVNSIDAENKVIHTATNETLHYSQLVLALGASAGTLPIDGNAADKILSVNDLASYAVFREAIKDKKKVAIIGAGLVGCEFANDLLLSGYEVSLIGLAKLPLDRLLPSQAGEYLKEALHQQGVNWYLGHSTRHIHYDNGLFQIELDDGTKLDADVVLSAVGLTANIQLAETAGIKIHKGIMVDQNLETNQQAIFALGDCAEVAGLYLPYVMPLMNSARALAKTLNGEKTAVAYPAMPIIVKTPSCPVVVAPPAPGIEGEWTIKSDQDSVHARFFDSEGTLQGYALVDKAVEDKQRLTKELPAVLSL